MSEAGMRTRWAAIGAAVAVSLGGGATWIAQAAGGGTASSLISIVPCRLMDTRPAPDTIGPRATPLQAEQPYVVTIWGANGNCEIPTTAVGVVMNVTAVNPSAPSFLSIYPADSSLPNVSSLNYLPGRGPTPNGVTVQLSADGKVALYNKFGTVDVIADIVGYYEPTAAGTPGPPGPKGDTGAKGDTGNTGPVGPLPTVKVSTGSMSIANLSIDEANADEVVKVQAGGPGSYLARLDAQLNNFGAYNFDYHCKLQSLTYPYMIGQPPPWVDIPGTRRDVSWRTGKNSAGDSTSATGVSISMQAAVSANGFLASVDVRMMCWGTINLQTPPGNFYDYGIGVESATLSLEPVGGFG